MKRLFLVRSEMLPLLPNTLSASRMYSPHNSLKFEQHVQTPSAPKLQTFFQTFLAFSKWT